MAGPTAAATRTARGFDCCTADRTCTVNPFPHKGEGAFCWILHRHTSKKQEAPLSTARHDRPMSMSARMSLIDWSLLLALSLLWGGSYFFVGVAVKALPPFTIVLLRVAIAAVALHVVLRLTRTQMPWDGRAWAAFFGMGLLNNAIPFSL